VFSSFRGSYAQVLLRHPLKVLAVLVVLLSGSIGYAIALYPGDDPGQTRGFVTIGVDHQPHKAPDNGRDDDWWYIPVEDQFIEIHNDDNLVNGMVFPYYQNDRGEVSASPFSEPISDLRVVMIFVLWALSIFWAILLVRSLYVVYNE